MKPILVLKQQEIMPEVMNMASGAPSAMSSISPLAFVPLPQKEVDPRTGLRLRAQGPIQYERPTFKPEVNPYGVFGSEGDFQSANVFSSNLETDDDAKAQLRRLGHDPKRINQMVGVERDAWAENRARKFEAKQERERAKFDTAQQKRQADMSLQEALSRQMAQSGGNSQAAFEEALRRTGRGALAGKIGAGALAGLTGLMALQRANESGTDLISALGGAGAQGYSTYRYANPTLQSLGMRGAAKISPTVGVSSASTSSPTVETPKPTKLDDFEGFDTGATTQSVAPPTVAPPTVAPPTTAQSLSSQEIVEAQNALGGGVPQHMAEQSHVSDEAMNDHKALTNEEKKMVQSTLDNWNDIEWSDDTNKGNRRSFIGVR